MLQETDESDVENMSPNEETPLRCVDGEYQRDFGRLFLAVLAVFVSTMLGAFVIAYIHR